MDRQERVTICEKKGSHYLKVFDEIIENKSRSLSILTILMYFIDTDINFLRNFFGLTPLSAEQILVLKSKLKDKLNDSDQVVAETTTQTDKVLPVNPT